MRVHLQLTLAVLILVAAAAWGPVAQPVSAQGANRDRTLFVSAVDSKGEPVEGLEADAFVVREDGVRREVLRVSRANEPIDVAILIDNSTAMARDVTRFRAGLKEFVMRMAPGNKVALIGLASRPTILVDYTDDMERLDKGLAVFSTPDSGMTLLDAIRETTVGLTKRETPRAVIVPVITDGVEFSNRDADSLVKQLVDARVTIHAVTVGMFPFSNNPPIRERLRLLEMGPRETGGQRITLLNATGLETALPRLARELLSQYKVVYSRPESLITPRKVTVASGRKGLTVRGGPAHRE
jgi:Ca-activated chloride channel family protein